MYDGKTWHPRQMSHQPVRSRLDKIAASRFLEFAVNQTLGGRQEQVEVEVPLSTQNVQGRLLQIVHGLSDLHSHGSGAFRLQQRNHLRAEIH